MLSAVSETDPMRRPLAQDGRDAGLETRKVRGRHDQDSAAHGGMAAVCPHRGPHVRTRWNPTERGSGAKGG